MRIQWLHIAVGFATVLVFLGTGAYMEGSFPELYAANEAIRYQFRANPIYLLMAGLVNLTAGLLTIPRYTGWRRGVSGAAAALVLLAPALLVAAFFVEPARGIAERPLTFYGVVMLVIGTLAAYLPVLVVSRSDATVIDKVEGA